MELESVNEEQSSLIQQEHGTSITSSLTTFHRESIQNLRKKISYMGILGTCAGIIGWINFASDFISNSEVTIFRKIVDGTTFIGGAAILMVSMLCKDDIDINIKLLNLLDQRIK